MPTLKTNEILKRRRADTAQKLAKIAMTRAAQAVLDSSPDAVQLAERALVLLKRADSARQACATHAGDGNA